LIGKKVFGIGNVYAAPLISVHFKFWF
jgi:hypothetical protein